MRYTLAEQRRLRAYRLDQLAHHIAFCDDDKKAKRLAREIGKVAEQLRDVALQERAERFAAPISSA